MRKLYIIGGIMIGLLGITSLVVYQQQYARTYRNEEIEQYNVYYYKYEEQCLTYVRNMNPLEQPEVDTLSIVLYMEYAIKKDNKREFDLFLDFIKKYLVQENGLIVGKVKLKEEVGAANNADETMKLMNLLVEAYKKWGDTTYRDLSLNLEKSLYDYNVQDHYLYTLYNTVMKKPDREINLGDLNLESMQIFADYRGEWKTIYQQSRQLLQKAYISEQFPFYHEIYDGEEDQYVVNKSIGMEDNLKIVLNLSRVGLAKAETLNWIKQTLKAGALYEEYDITTGKVSVHVELPQIYALVAQIGKVVGDNELYTLGIEKMLSFQVKDQQDEGYGAIRKNSDDKINLYENIQALLAF